MPRTRTVVRSTQADTELARRIGARLREARRRAGLTQQQLAGERYTKAYVSALETGIARPSMVALTYLAGRLGLPASYFLDSEHAGWTRLEADLRLAAGEWDAAADGYAAILEAPLDTVARAEALRGLAEARARLDHGKEAVAAASEAARHFTELGRAGDAALARYWLAYGLYQADAEADARSLLSALLQQVRDGLRVDADFEMRLLVALAAVESKAGEPNRALAYLEEARGLAADLDDRRRAAFLFNLAISYREVGDYEAAIRTGVQAVALYRSAGALVESARIENDLALAHLATGNVARAEELARDAMAAMRDAGDDRWVAAITETQAQVALARGDAADAIRLSAQARELGERSGNHLAALLSRVTEGRARRARGETDKAERLFREAAQAARDAGLQGRLREVLREWANLRADVGDHRGAYELTMEALTT
jgi:transcriptional regulator with XRE-family HTH domain